MISEQHIVEDVLARLRSEVGKTYDVQPFPDDPAAFQFAHPKGAILVRISDVAVADNSNRHLQVEEMVVVITLLSRNVNTGDGLYEMTRRVKLAIQGRTPDVTELKRPAASYYDHIRTTSVGMQDGVWQKDVEFSILVAQVYHPDSSATEQ